MRRLTLLALLLAAGSAAMAQEAPRFSVDGSVELYSAYIWRGDKVCGTQFSPCINFNYGRWRLQSFGFLAIDNSYKEIDWDLSYSFKDFSLHFAAAATPGRRITSISARPAAPTCWRE